MGNSSENSGKLDNTGVIELTGKIMVVSIILLFFIVFFVFCLHLYAKWFWYRRQENTTATTRRRRRFDFAAGHQEVMLLPTLSQGLDPLVLKSLPVIVFDPKVLKDGLECAVCLCEVSEGEKARLLPKCSHGFHVDCIDMWFQSHATCPLCRSPVANQSQPNSGSESTLEAPVVENSGVVSFNPAEAPNFPTNVLVWGNETRVSTLGHCSEEDHNRNSSVVGESSSSSSPSSSMESNSNRPDAVLVIDIPTHVHNEEEEQKSPVPTRLRSLKRLLSGNSNSRRVNPRNLDTAQGASRVQT